MRSSSSSLVVSLLALAIAACGSFDGDSAPGTQPNDPNGQPGAEGGPDGAPPPAPPVGEKPIDDQLDETFGIFVATTGADNADGTRAHPLARIQPAIDLARKVGKRVYVCTGTYREALVLSDSNSIIGGLSCTAGDGWRTGASRTKLEAPSSPAVRATNIVTSTRVEGLEIVAPTATSPSGSSIGLFAEHSKALVLAGSKIVASDGAKGDDGVEGTQLAQSATADGGAQLAVAKCVVNETCFNIVTFSNHEGWLKPQGVAGGTNVCTGAPGFVGGAGGAGGSGGLWKAVSDGVSPRRWEVYNRASFAPEPGGAGTGANGGEGVDGSNGVALGGFSTEGYLSADGLAGTDGAVGFGGAGGRGEKLLTNPFASYVANDDVYRGFGGSSGGAGGCPGRAGTPGKGGGASIAVLLVDSAIAIGTTEMMTGRGGDGGLGTLGSTPTAGGAGGPNSAAASMPYASGRPGGRGGVAGVSGNGTGGPSIGIVHVGGAPSLASGLTFTISAGGSAIAERSRTELGMTKTIPATPAGISKDILAL